MPVDIIPVAYKGGDGYFVSADGHVYSNKIGSMNALSEYADSDGYLRVCLTINKNSIGFRFINWWQLHFMEKKSHLKFVGT